MQVRVSINTSMANDKNILLIVIIIWGTECGEVSKDEVKSVSEASSLEKWRRKGVILGSFLSASFSIEVKQQALPAT